MSDKKIAAFGIYPSLAQAERGVDALLTRRVLERRPLGARARSAGHEGLRAREAHQGAGRRDDWHGRWRRARWDAGLLAGVGALAIPGLGPFIAAGPIMVALAGLGVGGAVGGFVGALVAWASPSTKRSATKGE